MRLAFGVDGDVVVGPSQRGRGFGEDDGVFWDGELELVREVGYRYPRGEGGILWLLRHGVCSLGQCRKRWGRTPRGRGPVWGQQGTS
jgi:hypothetical protein